MLRKTFLSFFFSSLFFFSNIFCYYGTPNCPTSFGSQVNESLNIHFFFNILRHF